MVILDLETKYRDLRKKVVIFDSTLSSGKVVPHPSDMIYKKIGVFDSTLRSRKVVPHPSDMIYEKKSVFSTAP